jgi:hypothetical protein
MAADAARIDRLLDAIELLKQGKRTKAQYVLRDLIQEDSDFEEAWLWMSVAVESLDQSSVCLDNVLRVNPENAAAASALYRIREPDMAVRQQQQRARLYRDVSLASMWLLALILVYVSMLVAIL